MSAQERFLRERGFKMGHSDVYAMVETEEEQRRAIEAIWKARVEGWWNHRLIDLGIATQEEFDQALDIECASRK